MTSLAIASFSLALGSSINTKPIRLGIYDPEKLFTAATNLSLEHIFVQWQTFNAPDYQSWARYAAERKRQLMVTVEPWTRAQNWRDGKERLLGEVTEGHFDREINAICNEIGATPGPILLRWGHEMEDDSGRYPWANRAPRDYIAAYRHFVDQCRRFAPDARYVWSPRGKQISAAYYPGNDYVDFIGISVYALQAWDLDHFGRAVSLDEYLSWIYPRVARFNKPIFMAEFGVSGDRSYKQRWLRSVPDLSREFDKLWAVVYFNSRETGAWPDPYGSPDWRITPDDLNVGLKQE